MKTNLRIFTLLLIGLIYVLLLRGAFGIKLPSINDYEFLNPKVYFESSQERARYIQMKSLLNSQQFNIDNFKELARPDLAWINGHYYPAYPPGISILLLPLFALGSLFSIELLAVNFGIAVVTILTGYLLMLISKKLGYNDSISFAVMVIYSLTTLAITYGVSLFQHNISAFLVTLCFYLFLHLEKNTNNYILFITFSVIGFMAFLVDYPNLIVLVPIFVATIIKKISLEESSELLRINIKSDLLFLLLSVLIMISCYFMVSKYIFNDPYILTNRYNLRVLDKNNIKYTDASLNMGMFKNITYSKKFSIAHLADGLNTMLFSVDRGLFFYAPIFLFLPYGLYKFSNFKIKMLILVIALLNLFFYASYDDPWGGWSFGPRYLLLSMPLFTLLLLPVIQTFIKSRFIFPILFTTLSIIPVLGATTSNLIPPIIESQSFKISSIVTSINYLLQNRSGSFIYQTFFSYKVELYWYYILVVILILFAFILVQKNYQHE